LSPCLKLRHPVDEIRVVRKSSAQTENHHALNLEQNDINKIYRAKMPGAQNISLFLRTWRALRPFGLAQDMLCTRHVFSDSVTQTSTENFKKVWL
jgi:hypothetical protein